MKEKRGILIKNVLVGIIAVLGLVLLFYGASKLYASIVDEDAENAKQVLNVIEAKVNALEDGQSNVFNIRGIEGWSLVGWGKKEFGLDGREEPKPDKCYFDSCICICKTLDESILDNKDYIENCQKGFCRKFDVDRAVVSTSDSESMIKMFPYIKLRSGLMELEIGKNDAGVFVLYDAPL